MTVAIRKAEPDEMEALWLMGYDAWGRGDPRDRYLDRCRASEHYRSGFWYVLTASGAPVSSLIVYRSGFALPGSCAGIGSVATDPAHRGQGYGTTLVREVTRRLGEDGVRGVYLHSEVGAAFYAALGYRPTDPPGKDPGSICMVCAFGDAPQLSGYAPDYF